MEKSTQTLDPELTETAHERTKPYVGSKWITAASKLLVAIGAFIAVVTTAFFINGITRAGSAVNILTSVHDESRETLETAFREALPATDVGIAIDANTTSRITLAIDESTGAEQVLARLDVLLAGFAILAGCILVSRIMKNIAIGDPFAPGTSRRFASLALIVGAFSFVQSIPGTIASSMALDRAGLPVDEFSTPANFDLFGIIVVPFVLLVLAEAFRTGGRLRADSEGLI